MRFFVRTLSVAAVAFLSLHLPADAQGRFKGELALSPMPDGRNMKLLQPFGYVDSKGQTWDVPSGMVTDGASIPRVFWTMFPPWTGKYRRAAIIHDHYCTTKIRTWQETHSVFYEAMLTEGMSEGIAKVMWAAVYNFGPSRGPGAKKRALPATEEEQERFITDLQAWVDAANPSREEIAKAIDLGRVPKF